MNYFVERCVPLSSHNPTAECAAKPVMALKLLKKLSNYVLTLC